MTLQYKLTPVSRLDDGNYDGIIWIADWSRANVPEELRHIVEAAAQVDEDVHNEGAVLPTSFSSKRLVYCPTGTLCLDYDDVRSFGEAASKGVKRAIKAGSKNILIALSGHDGFPQVRLVALLGVLEALYTDYHLRRDNPQKPPKVSSIGVWSDDPANLDQLLQTAYALECGRIAARDIGGPDPEVMAPPKVEEYVRKLFPPESGIKLEVINDQSTLEKEYPLYAAVNRAASVIERHRGRIMYLTYEGSAVEKTVLLVGKGVTYDTGGADIKAGGIMAGMCRDKCGAAAVAGFMRIVSILKPANLKVVGAMSMVRNSVGENCYVSDEVIVARSGKRVRVGNTDAEGRMIMADVLNYIKDVAKTCVNPHIFTIATLTGHACRTVGSGYTIALDNGPARTINFATTLQKSGEAIGDMIEISRIRREDYRVNRGKCENEDIVQLNNDPATKTLRGHQLPAAFLIMTAGLDNHGLNSSNPLKYTHLDIAPSAGDVPHPPTAAPVLALASVFLPLNV